MANGDSELDAWSVHLSVRLLVAMALVVAAGCTSDNEWSTSSTTSVRESDPSIETEEEVQQRLQRRRDLLPASVACSASYQPDTANPDRTENAELTVEPIDETDLRTLGSEPQTMPFELMSLDISYLGDTAEGYVVGVRIVARDGSVIQQSAWQIRDVDVADAAR